MTRKIAILRGINVGGKRKILMADLRFMFQDMNLSNIKTYIQSGNVIFDSNDKYDHLELSERIEGAITEKFGFEVPVIIRTPEELENVINKNPFYQAGQDISHLALTFLSEPPTTESKALAESYNYQPDRFVIDGREVFVFCAGKYHQSKLTNNFFEGKLKVNATTRNWKTVLQLLELSL